MKSNLKKSILFHFSLVLLTFSSLFAQENRLSKSNIESTSTIMIWNKNTPEQEMNDDIKALKEKGIIIQFSNIERNSKGEITAIKVTYRDIDGNSGSQEYNGKNPISVIKFYKNKDAIGFGENNNNTAFAFNDFNFDELQKSFESQIQIDTVNRDSFRFRSDLSPNIKKKSKIIIQENGKKPLVIEDDKIIEGGEGYTEEELNKIKEQQKFGLKNDGSQYFNFNSDNFDMKNLKEQMQKLQSEFMQIIPKSEKEKMNLKDRSKSEREELKEAKEEMLKAKKEMEEAKKELQKAKSEMKLRTI